MDKRPHEDFHEIWWLYSPERHEWGGLRLAHFRKTVDGTLLVIIGGEIDRRRVGPRLWRDIEEREGWTKVKQVIFPTREEIDFAVDEKLREIAAKVTKEAK